MHYVYEITNNNNKKTYIGQRKYTSNLEKDKCYMGSGYMIKKALAKYESDAFSKKILIDNITEQVEADCWEIYFIARNKRRDKAEYNIALGGNNHTGWALSSSEIRAKASINKK